MDEQQQYLTVKQFAERAEISTQRVYQLLTKSLQEFVKVENGTKYISVEGLKIFGKSDLQGVAKDLRRDLPTIESSEADLLRETVEALKQQLSVKDEQLLAKDKQISDLTAALLSSQEQHKALTAALTAAQALHAGTIQERLTAQADMTESSSDGTVEETMQTEQEPQEKKRKGFFARLFRKN